jgi:hypothetical protein
MNCYRKGALEAQELAVPCGDDDLRAAYLSIAKNWTDLADKIEHRLRSE